MSELIPKSDQRELLIFAFRYALGRATFAPHTVANVLKKAWPELSQGDKDLYIREIKEAIELDRAGMDIDKNMWLNFIEWSEGCRN